MRIRYRFTLPDRTERTFDVQLDPETLVFVPPDTDAEPPAWTALENAQCPNCPLATVPGA